VPPLRERGGDVILLAREFLERIRLDLGRPEMRLSAAAERVLLGHGWPGNVRELRNALEHVALLAEHATLEPDDFAGTLRRRRPPGEGEEDASQSLADVERRHVARVLEREGWVAERAARVLGISRTALYERMRKFGLARPTPRG
jgi:DNA-binding NtrC family response regulator